MGTRANGAAWKNYYLTKLGNSTGQSS